ncbi:MAG TPA: TIGR01777 family oxidoreductase [Kofleriaceae bacterium]|nr:TIGR01777 family oxidoreductase [Kofleriaceae bacterium]
MKRVILLGATGFVGRALVLALLGRGYVVRALSRAPARAARSLPAGVTVVDFADDAALADEVAHAHAIINLAGEPIAGPRWTARRKQILIDSRVETTGRLAAAIAARSRALPPLAAFINASASGYYGDRGDDVLGERDPLGAGFAAELCRRWEAAAAPAAPHVSRIVYPRLGVVLGLEGGMLGTLRPIYRWGLGGPVGDGRAWLPWIHLDDAVRAIVHLLEAEHASGPFNVAAPAPVRQGDFARAYGGVLHRPSIVPAPRFALRAALGEQASILTASQRLASDALQASGFGFRFPTLDAALADLVTDNEHEIRIERVAPGDVPASEYLRARPPRYRLVATTSLAAPVDEVFPFFSSPENLAALTPPNLAFEMTTPPAPVSRGQRIEYRIRVAGLPIGWRTLIEDWQPGHRFIDAQVRGPYHAWWHEHSFRADGGRTVMVDRVYYTPPLAFASEPIVSGMLRRIFSYRRHAIRQRFGAAADASATTPATAPGNPATSAAADGRDAPGSSRWPR